MVLYKQYVLPESLFIRDITELISSLKDELSEVLDDAVSFFLLYRLYSTNWTLKSTF